MEKEPENQSQSQPLNQPKKSTDLEKQQILPVVNPAKTINYMQDGIDHNKK